ncbi:MAG: malate dehydrogenase, partial [Nitrospirae bacterium]|nr:malate dehydrogenase [Nitrospirota bacterium]
MIKTDKISIIGAGNVGSLTAMRIAQENLGEVVLIDIAGGIAEGKSLDLEDCRSILQVNYQIRGTENIKEIKDSSVVVLTAGLARKPGMTREDLLLKNARIVKEVCLAIKALAQDAVVVVVTNPLDAMTYFALKVLGFSRRKVFGMGPTLDASRFANLIGQELSVQNSNIKATVIGSHGEAMLPLGRATFVNGIALNELVDNAKLESLIIKTKERGKQIVSLLGTGSAYFAP